MFIVVISTKVIRIRLIQNGFVLCCFICYGGLRPRSFASNQTINSRSIDVVLGVVDVELAGRRDH
ncbi:MAG: hypothetical protein MK097_20465, partial [Dechloromonas sp.]|nr:hypothetical protein [Dechloromonas sp.]